MRRVPVAVAVALLMLTSPALAAADPGSDYDFNVHLMILGLCLLPMIYFMPSVLAATRNHPKDGNVFVTNLLLGWTGIGWVVCMVWALSGKTAFVASPPAAVLTAVPSTPLMADDMAQEIEDLALQKHRYLISEAEYAQRKTAILERWKAGAAPLAPAAPN